MKFAAIVTAVAFVAVTNAASCDVTSLTTLLTSSDTTTCASDSGYAVTSLATPTEAEMAIMCTSTACQSVLSQLETLAPSECTLGTFALYANLITPLTNYCSGAAGSSTGSSATTATVGSTAGSSTSATVTTSSTGSAASTPATSTASSGSSGSSVSETTASSSSASASASASASSSANMVAVSAGAVLTAVAASFF